MTELVQYEPGVVQQIDPTGGRLVAWAQAASAANRLAKALSRTSFVPKDFQGNEYDATAAIIMGDELGLSPLAALRSIYVVHGSPAMYARTMVALAQSHGHQVWTEKSTDAEVVVCGQRRGTERIERAVWTMARATKAGYSKNAKYSSTPQEMLYAKAAAEVARKIAADVLAGVPFSVEDLELEPGTVTVGRAEPSAPKKVQRKLPEPSADAEPEFDEQATGPQSGAESGTVPRFDSEPAPDTQPDLITEQQSKLMFKLFHDKGFRDRNARLTYVNSVIGIDVESSKDLSKDQASQCIDALQQLTDKGIEPEPLDA